MSDNDGFLIVEGQSPDWIEIFNPTDSAILLSNFYLSDDADKLQKWQFPNILLQPHAFQVFYASGENTTTDCNFKINSDGEAIYLNDATATIDSFPAIAIGEDRSFGRFPDGGTASFFLNNPSPGNANTQNEEAEVALLFSNTSGFYKNAIALKLKASKPNTQIYYTRDGSIPNTSSKLYTDSILLTSDSSPVNNVYIPTAERWMEPQKALFKANVIRAMAYQNGLAISPLYTHTYFVHPEMETKYSFPIVSIITDSTHLFCDSSGIYVEGLQKNFSQRGRDWERPALFQFFEQGKQGCEVQQNIGIRTYGNKGRVMAQKSLLLYARDAYGKKRFSHSFFNDKETDSFKRLILRSASSNDWKNTLFKNELAQELAKNLNLEHPASTPVIAFINGEYWGIHHLAERMDEHFLEDYFQIDKDSIDYLSANANIEEGSNADYLSLINYINTHSLAKNAHYQHVAEQIDIANIMDYYIVQLFLSNTDWPYNNIKFWKAQNNGKWRWLFYDCDECMSYEYYDATGNFVNATQYHQDFPEWSTFLLHHLLQNESFNTQFRNRFERLLNSDFSTSRFFALADSLSTLYRPEVSEHALRWGMPNDLMDWEESVKGLYSFGSIRPTQMHLLLQEHFGNPFVVYPNPAQNEVYISTDVSTMNDAELSIYNSQGVLVAQKSCCDKHISTEHLNAGVYLFRLKIGNAFYSERVLIW